MVQRFLNFFSGGLDRREYAATLLVYILGFVALILFVTHSDGLGTLHFIVIILTVLTLKLILVRAVIKRLFSVGWIRWLAILLAVPYLNALFVLVLLFLPPRLNGEPLRTIPRPKKASRGKTLKTPPKSI